MYKLRSEQQQAVNSIFSYFQTGNKGNPLVVAPTGSGKSHIIAGFCAAAYARYPKVSILILTHTKEIISQNAAILKKYVSSDLVGIYSVGLKKREIRKFTIGGIQSVYKRANLFKDFSLIIVDEAHLIPPDGEGRYQTFFKNIGNKKIVGFTATPFRRKHGMLTEGHIFDKIIYDISIDLLIKKNYLVPLSSKLPDYVLNVKGVKSLGGDFSKADLSRKLDHTSITNIICDKLIKFKDLKKSWLIFAIDIEHCEHISQALNERGIIAAAVHSKLDFDRKDLLNLFKARYIQALVAVETLTTGFDAPNIDMIVLMRPTQSPVLHVQMLGRGMRPFDAKDNCLVLDFASNVRRLGPVDNVSITKRKAAGKGEGNGFTRICPQCKEIVHISKKKCPSCDYIFPIKPKLSTIVDQSSPLKKRLFTKDIKHISYSKHKKPGKIPSLKVTYTCGSLSIYNEWIAFEHKGYPRRKAIDWWTTRSELAVPNTIDEALQYVKTLRKPKQLTIEHIGKYPNITGYKF